MFTEVTLQKSSGSEGKFQNDFRNKIQNTLMCNKNIYIGYFIAMLLGYGIPIKYPIYIYI